MAQAQRFRAASSDGPRPIYTIGHSTRPIEEFIRLLRNNGVAQVVDVRTAPRSRTNPQYSADTLAASLAERDIAYAHIAALGGLRPKQRDVLPQVNAFWTNDSFHNYADYAMTAPFRQGVEELRALARHRTCAIVCAEAVWWRCHRRIVADHLLARGERVLHIIGDGRVEPAKLTSAAVPDAGGTVTYPARAERANCGKIDWFFRRLPHPSFPARISE